jgi:glycosyl transferase family 61
MPSEGATAHGYRLIVLDIVPPVWSALPVVHRLRSLARRPARNLEEVASKSWEIAPAHERVAPPALFLPEQWERITGFSEFSSRDGDLAKVRGGDTGVHGATRAFRIRDAILIDGVLYKGGASLHLHPRTGRIPRLRVEQEIQRGALYCTTAGNRFFGQWLMDDCVTYPLAVAEGVPVTTAQPVNSHTPGYESWLEMRPVRAEGAFFRELVVFEDVGQNQSKYDRFRSLGDRLRRRVEARPHPGVFIMRGATGSRRVLRNETEIAERLRDRRGFTIVDPVKQDVPAIVQACAGARTVVGVEGSGLMHGILVLETGGGLLVLQPPNRFSAIYKDLTDRDQQRFGFVVGLPHGDDFWVDPIEVERTLDLFAA